MSATTTAAGQGKLATSVAIATAIGGVATAASVIFLWLQVSVANKTLYSANSYSVQKDIATAYDAVIEAQERLLFQNENKSRETELTAAFRRQIVKLDTLFEAITALKNSDGLSNPTWKSLLRRNCPHFDKAGWRLAGVDTPSIRTACDSDTSWKGTAL